jgi:exodeoxyribonuclease VII large subunit
VIRDILHRLSERFPRRVLVWPVRVQGETSAAEVAAAIRGFNALSPGGRVPRPDLLIVARGGGSLEDLWCFNEEEVLRAAAASDIPLISAIGHETDWTLLDLVADLRAPTPTGAAEKAVPVRVELLANLTNLSRRHDSAALRLLERRRSDLRGLARVLPGPDSLLATPRQRLDRCGDRLRASLASALGRRQIALANASRLLARHAPHAELQRASGRLHNLSFRLNAVREILVERRRERLATLGARFGAALSARLALLRHGLRRQGERRLALAARLDAAMTAELARRRERLNHAEQMLAAVGYQAVLRRGFALVRDGADEAVRSVAQAPEGARLTVQFADGKIAATAGARLDGASPALKKRASAPRGTRDSGQGSLF